MGLEILLIAVMAWAWISPKQLGEWARKVSNAYHNPQR
jgi:hypothetical protein